MKVDLVAALVWRHIGAIPSVVLLNKIEKVKTEGQTLKTLIRLLFKVEQSDLSMHCLPRHVQNDYHGSLYVLSMFEVLIFHFLGVRHMKVDLVAVLVWKHMGAIHFVVLLH